MGKLLHKLDVVENNGTFHIFRRLSSRSFCSNYTSLKEMERESFDGIDSKPSFKWCTSCLNKYLALKNN